MSPASWFDFLFERLQTPSKYEYMVEGKIIRHTIPPAPLLDAESLA